MDNKVLVIDNYDSFTYNLVHAVEAITGDEVTVRRNDETTLEEVSNYEAIILSPGPGLPDEAGLLKEIIKSFAPKKKILGVCLGLQAIGEIFGAELMNLKQVYHGIKSDMLLTQKNSKLFAGVPEHFEAGRYHSWVIDPDTLPRELRVTCVDEQKIIMAIEHQDYSVYGVQFHPESIMTPHGNDILSNFLFKC